MVKPDKGWTVTYNEWGEQGEKEREREAKEVCETKTKVKL